MKDKKTFAWYVGNGLGLILSGCMCAIVIALTAKIIGLIL